MTIVVDGPSGHGGDERATDTAAASVASHDEVPHPSRVLTAGKALEHELGGADDLVVVVVVDSHDQRCGAVPGGVSQRGCELRCWSVGLARDHFTPEVIDQGRDRGDG